MRFVIKKVLESGIKYDVGHILQIVAKIALSAEVEYINDCVSTLKQEGPN
ncbi:hypothetical protein SBDP1_670007 [Syntrophobacter sp. SbD1]|nr:hypothetical protein SBDP1_670007 [Syntrophobacter sp. SbD1]